MLTGVAGTGFMPTRESSLANVFFAIATAVLIGYILIIGQRILVPLTIALVIAYFIWTIADGIAGVRVFGIPLFKPISLITAILIVFGVFYLLGNVIVENANRVAVNAPDYQQNLDKRISDIGSLLGIDDIPTISDLVSRLREINIATIVQTVFAPLTALAGNAVAIVIYTAFILWERQTFNLKISSLARSETQRSKIERTVSIISESIRRYLAVKTLSSGLVATLSYTAMMIIGIDFALFWGVLTFLFNFIPYIGSIVAVSFPIFLTLVQPGIEEPIKIFLVTGFVLTGIQQFVGSFVEPRIMGTTLNMSPLVIILSLAVWGVMWGVVGMLISIPIMVIMIIVLSQFESTRSIAILLSQTGKVDPIHDELLYLDSPED